MNRCLNFKLWFIWGKILKSGKQKKFVSNNHFRNIFFSSFLSFVKEAKKTFFIQLKPNWKRIFCSMSWNQQRPKIFLFLIFFYLPFSFSFSSSFVKKFHFGYCLTIQLPFLFKYANVMGSSDEKKYLSGTYLLLLLMLLFC